MTPVAVHAFADEAEQAGRFAVALGLPLNIVQVHDFPDGETLPTVPRAARTVLVYRSLHHPNAKLVPLLLACDAWRRAGVERLVLVVPYLCYLRQDTVFVPGQPVSRDAIGLLLAERFDRLVTVDPHLHRTWNLSAQWKTPVTVLAAAPALAAAVGSAPDTLVVGPDEESAPCAAALGSALGAPHIMFRKQRSGDREVALNDVTSLPVRGRRVVLVDDVCSTGMTLRAAVALARSRGARAVDIAVTHALFDHQAEQGLARAGARKVVFTDSCTSRRAAVSLAGVLAGAVRDEFEDTEPKPS